jgi:hypothetical protein
MIDPTDTDELAGAMPAGSSLLVILLFTLGLAAFAGAAVVGIMSAGLLGTIGRVLVAIAALFIIGVVLAAFGSGSKRILIAAVVLLSVAFAGACYAAIDSGRQYAHLKREFFAGRAGPRLVEPDSEAGRRMFSAMLSSIVAALGAITSLPLIVYLYVRSRRTDPA